LTKSKIVGIFLENMSEVLRPVLNDLQGGAVIYRDDKESADYFSRKSRMEDNISAFRNGCANREVNCSIHRDHGSPADELIEESRFADLLVLDARISFGKLNEDSPTGFVREILQKAECPVIIAPESFDGLDEIVFTYNGTASSVFAIKQFTYLFPQLQNKRVNMLQVNDTGEWQDRDKDKFNEWLKGHYTNLHFEVLNGDTENKLFDYLFKRKNVFIVMGAYGRSALSRFMYRSHADQLIKFVTQPIFITHF
jgi:hypothetical protein